MMRRKIILIIAGLLTLSAGLFAKGDSYIYDYWGEMEKSPDPYTVSHVVYADDLKLSTALKNPSSLFAKDNLLYVVDTDNNRIIELEYTEKKTAAEVEYEQALKEIEKAYQSGSLMDMMKIASEQTQKALSLGAKEKQR